MISLKKYPICIVCIFFSCSPAKKNPSTPVTIKNETDTIPYHPFTNDQDLDVLIRDIGDAKIVLVGESTHGTHEFYELRSAISKKLISQKGFDIIAIEGDWVDTWRVNQLVKGAPADSNEIIHALKQYDRWPSAMWGNHEMAGFISWLNKWNQHNPRKVGIFGLDLYSFWECTQPGAGIRQQVVGVPYSNNQVIRKLTDNIRDKFDSFQNDALKYAAAVKTSGINYSLATQSLYDYVIRYYQKGRDRDSLFILNQYALLALQGERYFRAMTKNKVESWNIRENYMMQTVKRLLEYHGKEAKLVIWVHNGHAGDVRYSQMAEGGYQSLGTLLEKLFPGEVYSIALGTNKGTVYGGYYWNAPLMDIQVPAARKGSWENILHDVNTGSKILLSKELSKNKIFNQWLPFRSIGAAYSDNAVYGTAILPKRFNAMVFIDSTTATRPVTH